MVVALIQILSTIDSLNDFYLNIFLFYWVIHLLPPHRNIVTNAVYFWVFELSCYDIIEPRGVFVLLEAVFGLIYWEDWLMSYVN